MIRLRSLSRLADVSLVTGFVTEGPNEDRRRLNAAVAPTGLQVDICFRTDDGVWMCVDIESYLDGGEAIAHNESGQGADLLFVLNSRFGGYSFSRNRTFDSRKPECLPKDVKDKLFDSWKHSGYGMKTGTEEWSNGIGVDANANIIATDPQSTFESNQGRIPSIRARFGGAPTHNRDSVPGLSITDKGTADRSGVIMYVMSRDGGLVMYNPKNPSTKNERYDSTYQQDYYGIKVGELGDRKSPKAFWNKSGVGC